MEIWKYENLDIWKSRNLEIWKSGKLEFTAIKTSRKWIHNNRIMRLIVDYQFYY